MRTPSTRPSMPRRHYCCRVWVCRAVVHVKYDESSLSICHRMDRWCRVHGSRSKRGLHITCSLTTLWAIVYPNERYVVLCTAVRTIHTRSNKWEYPLRVWCASARLPITCRVDDWCGELSIGIVLNHSFRNDNTFYGELARIVSMILSETLFKQRAAGRFPYTKGRKQNISMRMWFWKLRMCNFASAQRHRCNSFAVFFFIWPNSPDMFIIFS